MYGFCRFNQNFESEMGNLFLISATRGNTSAASVDNVLALQISKVWSCVRLQSAAASNITCCTIKAFHCCKWASDEYTPTNADNSTSCLQLCWYSRKPRCMCVSCLLATLASCRLYANTHYECLWHTVQIYVWLVCLHGVRTYILYSMSQAFIMPFMSNIAWHFLLAILHANDPISNSWPFHHMSCTGLVLNVLHWLAPRVEAGITLRPHRLLLIWTLSPVTANDSPALTQDDIDEVLHPSSCSREYPLTPKTSFSSVPMANNCCGCSAIFPFHCLYAHTPCWFRCAQVHLRNDNAIQKFNARWRDCHCLDECIYVCRASVCPIAPACGNVPPLCYPQITLSATLLRHSWNTPEADANANAAPTLPAVTVWHCVSYIYHGTTLKRAQCSAYSWEVQT